MIVIFFHLIERRKSIYMLLKFKIMCGEQAIRTTRRTRAIPTSILPYNAHV